jgi:hypothetical protein
VNGGTPARERIRTGEPRPARQGLAGIPQGHAAGTGRAGQTGGRAATGPDHRRPAGTAGTAAFRHRCGGSAGRRPPERWSRQDPGQLIEHTSGPAQSNSSLPVERCPKLNAFHTCRRPNKKTAQGDVPDTQRTYTPGDPPPRYMRGTCCPPVSAASLLAAGARADSPVDGGTLAWAPSNAKTTISQLLAPISGSSGMVKNSRTYGPPIPECQRQGRPLSGRNAQAGPNIRSFQTSWVRGD